MIRSTLVLLLGLSFYGLSFAQDDTITFPTTLSCGEQSKVDRITEEYKELGFANGKGVLFSNKTGEYFPALIKVYLSNSGSFTVTAEMDKGIICVLLVGEEFKPMVLTDKMH